jgi:hypothetical protein
MAVSIEIVGFHNVLLSRAGNGAELYTVWIIENLLLGLFPNVK